MTFIPLYSFKAYLCAFYLACYPMVLWSSLLPLLVYSSVMLFNYLYELKLSSVRITVFELLKTYWWSVEPCHLQELLRRASNRSGGGIPFMYVVIVGLVGMILGYLLKRTWLVISRFNRMIKIVESNKKQNVWYGKTNYIVMLYCS